MAFVSSRFIFKIIIGIPNIMRETKMRIMKIPVSMIVSCRSKTYSAVISNNRSQSNTLSIKRHPATEANALCVAISRKANCSKLATITSTVRDRFIISTQFHRLDRYSNPSESFICLISLLTRKHQRQKIGMLKRAFCQT